MNMLNLTRQFGETVPKFRKCGHGINPWCIATKTFASAGGTVFRGNYASLNGTHLTLFENILGKAGLSTDVDEMTKLNEDWYHTVKGASKLVLKPKTTEDVSEILNICNKERLAVCTQGGNTSAVGGGVPIFDEIVLSTARMNQVISFDEASGALVCQSGCILDSLNVFLLNHNRMVPLDLGSKGSCQIGGNVSTNAGGLRVIRYGNMHGNIMGLEVVLANGSILNCITEMKKNNTGYALKNLFIGAEGTLGVVTTVSLQTVNKSKAINVAFLGVKTYEDVLDVFNMAQKYLSEIISAFEYMDAAIIRCVKENLKFGPPIEEFPFYILIETSGSNPAHDEEKLHEFLGHVLEKIKSTNGTIAADMKQKNTLWSIRERIPEALLLDGYLYNCDFSVPTSKFDELVQEMRNRLGSSVTRCSGFGHLGDGNIHLVITSPKFEAEIESRIYPFVYEWVSKLKGSISAEHGLGYLKRNYMAYSNSPEAIKVMKDLKLYFDPNKILNPYKVFSTN